MPRIRNCYKDRFMSTMRLGRTALGRQCLRTISRTRRSSPVIRYSAPSLDNFWAISRQPRAMPACDGGCASISAPDVLVIDEIGYLSYSNRHADLLFELLNRRYEKKSTIVTTNKPFAQWQEVFPNAGCVVSLVDRLVHRSEVIAIEGKSYRLKEAEERSDRNQRRRRPPKPPK